jgi:acetyltransferase-like isoleucine patch superfamily enzyme
MLRKIYLSPLGPFLSFCMRLCSIWPKPFMIYGYYNKVQRVHKKYTRISSSAKLSYREQLNISNHVWIGHFSLLDGLGGIVIGEGVHIASHCCIYSHSSQNAIRLLGNKYIEVPAEKRPGYIIKKVTVGEFTFIGTSSIILPGVTIGKGCIIGAGSVVTKDVPDFSVVAGNPSKIIGDTKTIDERLLAEYRCDDTYYLNNTFK